MLTPTRQKKLLMNLDLPVRSREPQRGTQGLTRRRSLIHATAEAMK